jgi:hypothetical protein
LLYGIRGQIAQGRPDQETQSKSTHEKSQGLWNQARFDLAQQPSEGLVSTPQSLKSRPPMSLTSDLVQITEHRAPIANPSICGQHV